MENTIAAISSPPGPARRGILRLSGPQTRSIVNAALEQPHQALAEGAARCVLEGRFDDGRGTQPVTLFWMPGPRSYTREDVAELHLPGAPPLLAQALERLLALGARPAAPGEFTRRAFLNGRIDLSRAEGVLSLVQATSEAERRAATRLLEGGLERRVRGLREGLADLRALCEASLDFDEADTGHVSGEELLTRLDTLSEAMERALSWEVARQPPTALPRVLLFGAPNAGKSSLFNRLVPEGAAIVSDFAGTTRDALVGIVPLGGAAVSLLDAPGLDAGARGPDATAQRLAAGERGAADLILWVIDGTTLDPRALAREAGELPPGIPVQALVSKSDLASREVLSDLLRVLESAGSELAARLRDPLALSALERTGLEELSARVGALLGFEGAPGSEGEAPVAGLGRELFARHRRALERGRVQLEEARCGLIHGHALDQVAETLRAAGAELDEISGETTVEDVLDRIFERFCIGK